MSTELLANIFFIEMNLKGDYDNNKLQITLYDIPFKKLQEIRNIIEDYNFIGFIPNHVIGDLCNIKIFLND